jgi:sulfatase modifying factor 1
MVLIPHAEFLMGTPEWVLDRIEAGQHYDRTWFEDEAPQHKVSVPTYFIDKFPVTNGQYLEFTGQSGYKSVAERRGFGLIFQNLGWKEIKGVSWRKPGGPQTDIRHKLDHPVVHMAHEDARAYAEWAGKRLPTEAEWELASRGVEFRVWPWGDTWERRLANAAEYWAGRAIADLDDWYTWWPEYEKASKEQPGTTPVGFLGEAAESPFGVADMAGNVMEWTDTTYFKYDPTRTYDAVFEMVTGKYMSVRGGCWMSLRYQVRCCERMAGDPSGYSSFIMGFRCARDAE